MDFWVREAMPEPNIPPYCSPTTPFLLRVSDYFGTCIPTPLAFLSTLLGSLSILSWLWAQMPQIYKNYQLQSTAGLSLLFLAEWLAGDVTNLFGALFTGQAAWQVIIASYYTFVDICLVCQFFWYTHFKPRLYGDSFHSGGSSSDGDEGSDMIGSLSPINTSFGADEDMDEHFNTIQSRTSSQSETREVPKYSQNTYEKHASPVTAVMNNPEKKSVFWTTVPSPNTLARITTFASLATSTAAIPFPRHVSPFAASMMVIQPSSKLQIAGKIISWCSTILYLGSRLPQLYKNWKRKSTAGLSPLLFFAAFCGNFFYSTSMLTNPNAWSSFGPHGGHGWVDQDGSNRAEWVLRAAPFFLGAAGVLLLDAMMGIQFLMYSERQEEIIRVRDSRGFSRWEKVNGWMRGWIPEMKKARTVDLAESQRLLAESREIERLSHGYGGI